MVAYARTAVTAFAVSLPCLGVPGAALAASRAKAPPPIETPAPGPHDGALGNASEIMLPAFQAGILEHDLPAHALTFVDEQTLMILGTSSLWRWQLLDRSLKRLNVRPAATGEQAPLTQLATDGVSWFAASDAELYQVHWEQSRVFRFVLPVEQGSALGFGGEADNFWLLHSSALFKIDRYGRALRPKARLPFLTPGDSAVLDGDGRALWYSHGVKLYRVDLTTPGSQPVAALTATHPLLDLQRAGAGLIARTARAVLRISPDGKLKRSIPVEGRRKLVAMHIGPKAHAYLFDDHLLEVFRPAQHATERYRLPMDNGDEAAHLSVADHLVALTVDGHPRIFHLRAPD